MSQSGMIAYLMALLLVTLGGSYALSKASQSHAVQTFEVSHE
jgi:hypothetical protein